MKYIKNRTNTNHQTNHTYRWQMGTAAGKVCEHPERGLTCFAFDRKAQRFWCPKAYSSLRLAAILPPNSL